MKVLWLSMNPGLYGVSGGNMNYNGGGWISSLQQLFLGDTTVDIALVFTTPSILAHRTDGNFSYYPIHKQISKWRKIKEYYGGYQNLPENRMAYELQDVISNYQPDIIHIFGLENDFADILGHTYIPSVVHLQGLLSPIRNAFWPQGINEGSFRWPPSRRETLLRNGYRYDYKSMFARSEREEELCKRVSYAMGRTSWDKNYMELMAPQAKYFHVDEVLRSVFYINQGEWKAPEGDKFRVVSTISDTMYKGLDFVLKTAALLKRLRQVDFEWYIVGINRGSRIVSFFERELNIKSDDVNVKYVGVLDAEKLCEMLLNSSVYVHPSYIDNSPNSVCEAQLLGMPVVATHVGGVSSLLDGADSLQLVPANGVYELAHSLIMLKDYSLALKIGRKGYALASTRHDRGRIKQRLLQVYSQIIV